ncbi:MAG: hypothetical protein D6729_04355 [Deltaproteobacteria bacterium]|nr:MAG: hypothetical protein D6729_04355 [Deltaproteobacteria bacterium]
MFFEILIVLAAIAAIACTVYGAMKSATKKELALSFVPLLLAVVPTVVWTAVNTVWLFEHGAIIDDGGVSGFALALLAFCGVAFGGWHVGQVKLSRAFSA